MTTERARDLSRAERAERSTLLAAAFRRGGPDEARRADAEFQADIRRRRAASARQRARSEIERDSDTGEIAGGPIRDFVGPALADGSLRDGDDEPSAPPASQPQTAQPTPSGPVQPPPTGRDEGSRLDQLVDRFRDDPPGFEEFARGAGFSPGSIAAGLDAIDRLNEASRRMGLPTGVGSVPGVSGGVTIVQPFDEAAQLKAEAVQAAARIPDLDVSVPQVTIQRPGDGSKTIVKGGDFTIPTGAGAAVVTEVLLPSGAVDFFLVSLPVGRLAVRPVRKALAGRPGLSRVEFVGTSVDELVPRRDVDAFIRAFQRAEMENPALFSTAAQERARIADEAFRAGGPRPADRAAAADRAVAEFDAQLARGRGPGRGDFDPRFGSDTGPRRPGRSAAQFADLDLRQALDRAIRAEQRGGIPIEPESPPPGVFTGGRGVPIDPRSGVLRGGEVIGPANLNPAVERLLTDRAALLRAIRDQDASRAARAAAANRAIAVDRELARQLRETIVPLASGSVRTAAAIIEAQAGDAGLAAFAGAGFPNLPPGQAATFGRLIGADAGRDPEAALRLARSDFSALSAGTDLDVFALQAAAEQRRLAQITVESETQRDTDTGTAPVIVPGTFPTPGVAPPPAPEPFRPVTPIEPERERQVTPIPPPEPAPAPERELEPVTDPDESPRPIPEPAPGPEPVPEPAPGPEPVPEPTPGPEPVPEPTPGPEPVPEPGPGPEPVPGPTPGPAPGPGPAPVPEPAPEPEPVPERPPASVAVSEPPPGEPPPRRESRAPRARIPVRRIEGVVNIDLPPGEFPAVIGFPQGFAEVLFDLRTGRQVQGLDLAAVPDDPPGTSPNEGLRVLSTTIRPPAFTVLDIGALEAVFSADGRRLIYRKKGSTRRPPPAATREDRAEPRRPVRASGRLEGPEPRRADTTGMLGARARPDGPGQLGNRRGRTRLVGPES